MNDSQKHLDFFIQLIPKMLLHFQEREINSIQKFSLGLLDRLLKVSLSLKVIIQKIDTTPELEFSAGIIVRAMILDMLIGLNFYKLLKDCLSKNLTNDAIKYLLQEFCNRALADGLDSTAKSLKLAKDLGYISSSQLEEAFNNFGHNQKKFLNTHLGKGEMPESKYGKGDSPSVLFKNIACDSAMKNIAGMYDLYLFYSKYDHFGILYFETLDISHNENKERLTKAIRLFVNHCANLYDIIERVSEKGEFITSQLKTVEVYLDQKNGV